MEPPHSVERRGAPRSCAVEACLAESDALPADVDTRSVARFALTTMEGGVMLACTCRDIAPFDDAIDIFRRILKTM